MIGFGPGCSYQLIWSSGMASVESKVDSTDPHKIQRRIGNEDQCTDTQLDARKGIGGSDCL